MHIKTTCKLTIFWFKEIGGIFLACLAMVFISGPMLLFHNRELFYNCKQEAIFWNKSNRYLLGQYILLVVSIIFAFAVNAVFWYVLYLMSLECWAKWPNFYNS